MWWRGWAHNASKAGNPASVHDSTYGYLDDYGTTLDGKKHEDLKCHIRCDAGRSLPDAMNEQVVMRRN